MRYLIAPVGVGINEMKITETKLRNIVRLVLSEALDVNKDRLKQSIIQVVGRYSTDMNLYESSFDGMLAEIAKDIGMTEGEVESLLHDMFTEIYVPRSQVNHQSLKDAIIYEYIAELFMGGDKPYYSFEMDIFKELGMDYDADFESFQSQLKGLMGISRLGIY